MLATNVNRGYTPESPKSSLALLSCSLIMTFQIICFKGTKLIEGNQYTDEHTELGKTECPRCLVE